MRHVWMFVVGVLLLVLTGLGDFHIGNVRATPVVPWGRIVVDYVVTGQLPTNAQDYVTIVMASNRMDGTVYTGGCLEGETALSLGLHRIWWDIRATGLQDMASAVDVTISYSHVVTADQARYCVIDLSGGRNAVTYPVSYLREVPSEGWTDEYKTTKLVLRRIEAGTFIMGDDQDDESHRVTLTKPFYLGVFEVTQKQWELVMGTWPEDRPSSESGMGDTYPAYNVSYNDIRGSSLGAQWPISDLVDTSSFLGRLRDRTNLDFDLPTEAQWEYACRAGTRTSYYWGTTMDDAYTWHSGNSDSKTRPVGMKLPNAWGLYDMSGNVWERCRDWEGELTYGTDPLCTSSGSWRIERGGSWRIGRSYCYSFYRNYDTPSYRDTDDGFRLFLSLP